MLGCLRTFFLNDPRLPSSSERSPSSRSDSGMGFFTTWYFSTLFRVACLVTTSTRLNRNTCTFYKPNEKQSLVVVSYITIKQVNCFLQKCLDQNAHDGLLSDTDSKFAIKQWDNLATGQEPCCLKYISEVNEKVRYLGCGVLGSRLLTVPRSFFSWPAQTSDVD